MCSNLCSQFFLILKGDIDDDYDGNGDDDDDDGADNDDDDELYVEFYKKESWI